MLSPTVLHDCAGIGAAVGGLLSRSASPTLPDHRENIGVPDISPGTTAATSSVVRASHVIVPFGQVWQLSGLIADRLQGGVLGVAIDDGPYLALAELAGWRRHGQDRTSF